MSRDLIVELSEGAYSALEHHAQAVQSPAKVAAEALEQQFGMPDRIPHCEAAPTEADRQAARLRFERHFGAVNLGYATGVDNDDIDADLARAYSGEYEKK